MMPVRYNTVTITRSVFSKPLDVSILCVSHVASIVLSNKLKWPTAASLSKIAVELLSKHYAHHIQDDTSVALLMTVHVQVTVTDELIGVAVTPRVGSIKFLAKP